MKFKKGSMVTFEDNDGKRDRGIIIEETDYGYHIKSKKRINWFVPEKNIIVV